MTPGSLPGRRAFGLLAAFALGGWLGCDHLQAGLERFSGTFRYMASDAVGRPAFGGSLFLTVHADSSVTGTYDASNYRSRAPGDSPVVGRVHGDSLSLWLDPNPDGGILVESRATDGGFTGSWSANTIAGPQPGGGFFAQRATDPLPAAP